MYVKQRVSKHFNPLWSKRTGKYGDSLILAKIIKKPMKWKWNDTIAKFKLYWKALQLIRLRDINF